MSTTFSLASALGWNDLNNRPIPLNPIIAMTESAGISSDLLHSLIISHLLLTNHTVCAIGIKYPFSHLSSLCKKIGPINLEQYLKSGQLLYIDCLNAFNQAMVGDKTDANNDTNQTTALPTEYASLLTRVAGAHTIHSKRKATTPSSSQPFSICIDDLTLLNSLNVDINSTTNNPSLGMIDFLTNLLQFSNLPLFQAITQHAALPSTTTTQSTTGTLSFTLVSESNQIGLNPKAPSTLFKQPHATSLILQNNNITPTETDPRCHSVFDIPITNGGATAHVIHWVNDLNFHLYQIESKQLTNNQTTELKPNNTTLLIELSALVSGYSKDIYCQLTIMTPPNVLLGGANNNNGMMTSPIYKSILNILFLVIGTGGTLMCHSRA